MAVCNFIMQGEGGIGKALVAALLFQYLQKRGFTAETAAIVTCYNISQPAGFY